MADIKQLEAALMNADKAGDVEAARALAGEIIKMRQAPAQPQAATTSPDRLGAALSGLNRGIAGVAGLPGDTAENIVNLGIAGYGAARQAITGKPGPDLVSLPGTSRWIAERWEQGGIPTSNPSPEDPASRMIHTGAMVAGGSLGGRPIPTATAAGTTAAAGEFLGPEFAAPAAMAAGGFSQATQAARQRGLTAQQAANTNTDRAAAAARKEGYVIPPSQANPSLWSRALEGFAGKLTTAQHASAKNQQITNTLAKRSLGLADDAPLNETTLKNIRDEAGASYQAIKDFGGGKIKFRPDGEFKKAIDGIGGDYAKAAREVPELAKVKAIDDIKDALQRPISPAAAVELVKKLRKDASVNFKAFDNPEKLATAKAQRDAAEAIEGLVERNLAKAGQGDMVRNFREARTTIARTYDIEAALNDASGNVSAKAIAKIAGKKPLGDDAKKIADFAGNFPKAAQMPEQMGSLPGISPLDVMAGAGGYFIDPTLAALAAARPGVRHGILSSPYQNMMAPSYRTPVESDLSVLLRPSVLANQ